MVNKVLKLLNLKITLFLSSICLERAVEKKKWYKININILVFQLREEYGYEINPNDPQFAERIEEKEKEIAKAKKQDKKSKQLEQKEKYAAKLQAEKEEKLKKVQVIQLKCLYKHSFFLSNWK